MAKHVVIVKPPADGDIRTAFPELVVHDDEAPLRWRADDQDERSAHVSYRCTDPKHGAVVIDASSDPDPRWRMFKLADIIMLEDDNWPIGKPRPNACACGAVLAPDAKFCADCGAARCDPGPMICATCSAPLAPAAKFCIGCGARVVQAPGS